MLSSEPSGHIWVLSPGPGLSGQGLLSPVVSIFNATSLSMGYPWSGAPKQRSITPGMQPTLPAPLPQDGGHWDSGNLERAHSSLTHLAQDPKLPWDPTFIMYLEGWSPSLFSGHEGQKWNPSTISAAATLGQEACCRGQAMRFSGGPGEYGFPELS